MDLLEYLEKNQVKANIFTSDEEKRHQIFVEQILKNLPRFGIPDDANFHREVALIDRRKTFVNFLSVADLVAYSDNGLYIVEAKVVSKGYQGNNFKKAYSKMRRQLAVAHNFFMEYFDMAPICKGVIKLRDLNKIRCFTFSSEYRLRSLQFFS